jgi:hypothetical protein
MLRNSVAIDMSAVTGAELPALYMRALLTFNRSCAYQQKLEKQQTRKDIRTGNARFGQCVLCSHLRDTPAVPRGPNRGIDGNADGDDSEHADNLDDESEEDD